MSCAAGLVWLVAAEVGDLSLPHGESSRPRICEVGRVEHGAAPAAGGAWERVRREPYEALCLGLARAQIRLEREPTAVVEQARELARGWPGRPEPKLLEARALARSGDAAASWTAWQAASALAGVSDAAALGPDWVSAFALRDLALAAVGTGRSEVAIGTYRRLVSLLDAWPDPRHVQRLYLEAAAASLRAGVPRFDEALGYIAGALARARSTGLAAYAAGLEAWAIARRGTGAAPPRRLTEPEIWHFVAEARAPRAPSYWPVLPKHEALAVASLLVEPLSAVDAAGLWEDYVRGLDAATTDPATLQFARDRGARLAGRRSAP
jgi:hypothetical protein